MALNESKIPDLLSEPVNIKWEEGAPSPVASAFHTAVLYNGTIYVGGGACNDDDTFKININFIIQIQTSGMMLLTLHMHSLP